MSAWRARAGSAQGAADHLPVPCEPSQAPAPDEAAMAARQTRASEAYRDVRGGRGWLTAAPDQLGLAGLIRSRREGDNTGTAARPRRYLQPRVNKTADLDPAPSHPQTLDRLRSGDCPRAPRASPPLGRWTPGAAATPGGRPPGSTGQARPVGSDGHWRFGPVRRPGSRSDIAMTPSTRPQRGHRWTDAAAR